jgi:hypothetical protein
MVVEALLDVLGAVWGALLSIIPMPPDFSFIEAPVVLSVAGDVGAMGSWLPLVAISTVVAVMLSAWLAAGGVVIARMVLSLFTGGGGNVGGVR